MKFKSKTDPITRRIGELIELLPEATSAFADLVAADPKERPDLLETVKNVEKLSDTLYIELLRKVTDTFITPFDREDIYRIVENSDDVVDEIEHTSILIVELGMKKLPSAIEEGAIELHQMAQSIEKASRHLKKPKKMEKLLFEANACENRLDTLYRKSVIAALAEGTDPLEATRITVIAHSIELIASYLDNFTRALAVTAIKET